MNPPTENKGRVGGGDKVEPKFNDSDLYIYIIYWG